MSCDSTLLKLALSAMTPSQLPSEILKQIEERLFILKHEESNTHLHLKILHQSCYLMIIFYVIARAYALGRFLGLMEEDGKLKSSPEK
jgi:hypothetical protein